MTTPQERQQVLAEMEAALGRPPTADEIIEAATPEDHVLHGDFEWDNTVAGHHWRQNQARAILRCVQVLSVIHGRALQSVVYVRNPNAGRLQGYINVRNIEPRSQEALQVLQMCVSRIRSHIHTARNVAAVLGLEHELQVLLEQLIILERKATAQAQRGKTKRQKARS